MYYLADYPLSDTMWIPPHCLFLTCRTGAWLWLRLGVRRPCWSKKKSTVKWISPDTFTVMWITDPYLVLTTVTWSEWTSIGMQTDVFSIMTGVCECWVKWTHSLLALCFTSGVFICSDGAVTWTLVQAPVIYLNNLWCTSYVLYAPLFFVHFCLQLSFRSLCHITCILTKVVQQLHSQSVNLWNGLLLPKCMVTCHPLLVREKQQRGSGWRVLDQMFPQTALRV